MTERGENGTANHTHQLKDGQALPSAAEEMAVAAAPDAEIEAEIEADIDGGESVAAQSNGAPHATPSDWTQP